MTNFMGLLNNISGDTGRGPSTNVWRGIQFDAIRQGHIPGIALHDDFVAGPQVQGGTSVGTIGPYEAYSTAGCSILDGGEQGGTLVFTTDASNEGAALGGTTCVQIDTDKGDFAFECRLKKSALTDSKAGFFIGLQDAQTLSATVPIAADGTLADTNHVGFHNLEADGDTFDTVYKADGVTAVTVAADAVTVVADTYVKLGMRYHSRTKLLKFYKDGVELADSVTIPAADGTDFPNDVRMGLVAAILGADTSAPTVELDWWRIAQEI